MKRKLSDLAIRRRALRAMRAVILDPKANVGQAECSVGWDECGFPPESPDHNCLAMGRAGTAPAVHNKKRYKPPVSVVTAVSEAKIVFDSATMERARVALPHLAEPHGIIWVGELATAPIWKDAHGG